MSALLTWASGVARAEAPGAHWIFFADRQAGDLEAQLRERERELDPRAVARRRRVMGRAVDENDLLPSAAYLEHVATTGARVRSISRWLNAVSVEATESQLDQLRTLPEVSRVAPVARQHRVPEVEGAIGTTVPSDPGEPGTISENHLAPDAGVSFDYGPTKAQLDLIGAPAAHACGLTGKGIVVGFLDSGFELTHPATKHIHVLGQHDFVKGDDVVSNEAGDPRDQATHGTSTLSLLAGLDPGNYVGGAPDVSVLLAKTEDVSSEVMSEEDNYVAGLEWVEMKGADLASSSLGYLDWWKPEDFDGKTAPTTKAVNAAVTRGMVCLTATGNEGPGEKTLGVPADAVGVLSIGAVGLNGSIASFSSRGPTADGRIKPEFVAPGARVRVAVATGGYMNGDGTSYATPLAAAMVALLLQSNPTLTPSQVFDILKASAVTKGPPDNTYGYGLIDIAKATADYCSCRDADGDGAKSNACGGPDCNDDDAKVHPGAAELCTGGLDENCDGLIDGADPACAGTTPPPAAGSSGMAGAAGAIASVPAAGATGSAGASGTAGATTAAPSLPAAGTTAAAGSGVAPTGTTTNAITAAGTSAPVVSMIAPPANAAEGGGCNTTPARSESGFALLSGVSLTLLGMRRRRSAARGTAARR